MLFHQNQGTSFLPIWVTISPLTEPNQGSLYNFQLIANGNPEPTFTIISGSLPTGLNMNNSGLISGTPSNSGNFNITVRASNIIGNSNRSFTLNVNSLPIITTTSIPGGTPGQSYNATITATGSNPITFSISNGALPLDLSMTTGGVISGTLSSGFPTITTSSPLTSGIISQSYSTTIVSSGSQPITFSIVNGALPTGLSLSNDGNITGTPSSTGTSTFVIRATNGFGTNDKSFNLTIATHGFQIFTTPGSGTFTVPTGVISLTIECWGGGGGDGASFGSNTQGGSGGGGGGYSIKTISTTPGTQYSYTVGSGGNPGGTNPGTSGSSSSVSGLINASGGSVGGNQNGPGGIGGSGSGGDVNYTGGTGGAAAPGQAGGGGGGAGGSNSNVWGGGGGGGGPGGGAGGGNGHGDGYIIGGGGGVFGGGAAGQVKFSW